MIYVLAAIALTVVMSIITFALYAIDKRRAEKNKWRIKESTLILFGFLMGAVGAVLGMKRLRHKTQHLKFKILVPLALIVNIAVIGVVVWLTITLR